MPIDRSLEERVNRWKEVVLAIRSEPFQRKKWIENGSGWIENMLSVNLDYVEGLGTRMLPVTKEQPKEMLPVFCRSKRAYLDLLLNRGKRRRLRS